MNKEKAVALILEARRQGYVEAKELFDISCKQMREAYAVRPEHMGAEKVEALQAEVERLKALAFKSGNEVYGTYKVKYENITHNRAEEIRLAEDATEGNVEA